MSSYGPQLPPGLQKTTIEATNDGSEVEASDKDVAVPSADCPKSVAAVVIGPSLPPGFVRPARIEAPPLSTSEIPTQKRIVGPTLPPNFHRPPGDESEPTRQEEEEEEEEDVVGPSLSLMAGDADFSALDEVSERFARKAEKLKKSQEPVVQQRESWMTDLPAELLGRNSIPTMPLGPRTFKRKTDDYEADFSGWTSGPSNGQKRKEEEKSDSLEALQFEGAWQRERQLEMEIEENNKKKRGVALVTMVQKTVVVEGKKERRPFDREKDLNVGKTVKMDKEGVAQRAAALKEKFATSSKAGQKFL